MREINKNERGNTPQQYVLFSKSDEIFLNPYLLSDEYVPRTLISRDHEIREAAELFMDPLQNGSLGINALFFGPPGSGKSVVMKLVIREVRAECHTRGIHNLAIVYLKVRGLTNTAILYKMIQNLTHDPNITERGLDEYYYKNELYALLRSRKMNLIVVFDEIDQLPNDNLIYDLSRAGADGEIEEGQFINIIGLTNDLYYRDRMASKTVSSFKPRQIPFNAYTPMELVAILADRSGAFISGVLDEEVIPLCAATSARDNGDARKALWLLSNAGKLARREGATRVTSEHVNKATEYFDADIISIVLQQLPFNVKTVLHVICSECTNGKTTNSVTVWKRYQNYCALGDIVPVSRSRVSQILTELRELGLLRTHDRPGKKGGTFREIDVSEHCDKIINILKPSN